MKTKNLFLVLLVALFTTFVSCTNSNQQPQYQNQQSQTQPTPQVVVNELQPNIGDNLNLNAVGELIKQCKDPNEIERRLNADGTINNLDMDGDGQRDYIKVTETIKGTYKLSDVQKDGDCDLVSVNVDIQNSTININGNPQYYGNNCNYQSNFTTTDFLLMSYLMSPHWSYYRSPYYYGHYGYGYRPVPIMPYSRYHSSPYVQTARTKTTYRTVTTTTTTHSKSSPTFNNSSKTVQNHVNLSNPTHTQKEFKARDNSQPIRSGGFNDKPKPSNSNNSYSKPSSSYSKPSNSYSKPSSSYSKPSSSYSKPSSSWGHSSSGSSGGRRK